jgi:hypothetical protein
MNLRPWSILGRYDDDRQAHWFGAADVPAGPRHTKVVRSRHALARASWLANVRSGARREQDYDRADQQDGSHAKTPRVMRAAARFC